MIFHPTAIAGAFVIEQERREDDRGFFARAFCAREFADHGLDPVVVNVNNSLSAHRGTMRGIHYQLPPKSEAKTIRVLRGSMVDAVVDLRPDSPTFGRYVMVTLTAEDRRMVHIPKGCANGFMTLEDNTEVMYFVSEYYSPAYERGIRWNDPFFAIPWPLQPTNITDKDSGHPDFDPARNQAEIAAAQRG
ncbi:MAG: dTDP-4-dehydrorhamnose 3,5-epimerase [Alphaproteobacteria bacterium]